MQIMPDLTLDIPLRGQAVLHPEEIPMEKAASRRR